jgi:LPS sulfotransferase NodH
MEGEYERIAAEVHAQLGDCPSGAAGMAGWLGLPYRRGPSAEHDVVDESLDQPRRTPRRTLVLASTYRSGSTVLAEDLITAGGYGWPIEYFQAGAQERRFARFSGVDYPGEVMSRRTDDNGVFGVKLFPADLRREPGLWSRLPDPVVVRVRRRDRIGQAVSTWRALNGGAWRSLAGQHSSPPPDYDFESLRRLVGLFAWEDAWWDSARGVVATVWFEDLVSDHTGAVAGLLRDLMGAGLPPRNSPAEPRLVRQADADSLDMAQRFIRDYRAATFS